MSRLNFYTNEAKPKLESIYMEISQELGISYPKVVGCVRDGLFKYVKEFIFKNFENIQIRGFGTFYISKVKMKNLNEKKQLMYDEARGIKKDNTEE